MERGEFDQVRSHILKQIRKMDFIETSIEGVNDHITSDELDIGNHIGIAFGEMMMKYNLDKDSFISGIKHGISLKDGTHP
jgi:hypothetical protein